MAFRVGQKVVCVDATSPAVTPLPGLPVASEGGIYTVTKTQMSPLTGRPSLQLLELPDSFVGAPLWYQAKRFRPVVERKTDISIFEKMLTGGKQPARV